MENKTVDSIFHLNREENKDTNLRNCASAEINFQYNEILIGKEEKEEENKVFNKNDKNFNSFPIKLKITKLDSFHFDRKEKEKDQNIQTKKIKQDSSNLHETQKKLITIENENVIKLLKSCDNNKPDKVILLNDGKKIYQCGICDKQLKQRYSLTLHKSLHYPPEKMFSCTDCQKTFRTKSLMKKHSAAHRIEKPFKCVQCAREFSHHANLKEHLNRYHTGERNFKCEQCGKCFITATERSIHLRSHSNQRLFVCEICGKNFKLSSALKCHHDRHSSELKYGCEICFKSFYSNTALKEHIRTHSEARPHICSVCGHTFKKVKMLRQHILLHGDKTFLCKICDKAFSQPAGLHAHMKSHIVIN